MPMKRTNIFADPADLAMIRETDRRRDLSKAEIIRQGIHLAALANQVWDKPFFPHTYSGSGRTVHKSDVTNTIARNVRQETDDATTAAP